MSQSHYSLISRISGVGRSRANLILKLRVVRSYSQPIFGNPDSISSYELVFHDRAGDRIHGTIRVQDYERFDGPFVEGELYDIQYIQVDENKMKYKTCNNSYKFVSHAKTDIVRIKRDDFPYQKFVFRSFSTLQDSSKFDDTMLFDVIGRVAYTGNERVTGPNDRVTKILDVKLEDLSGTRIPCTLWGDFVDTFVKFAASNSNHPIILILHFARGKIYKGEVYATTTYNVTQMYLNGDFEEVIDFKSRMIKKSSLSSPNGSSLSTSSIASVDDELNKMMNLKNVKALKSNFQVGYIWVYARIDCVDAIENWYYPDCAKCNKKVHQIGHKYFCDKCNVSGEFSGSYRYKLLLHISDDTDHVSVLLWNREAVQLIGQTAAELKSKYSHIGQNSQLPAEIHGLKHRELLFKLQQRIEISTNSFSVIGVQLDTSSIVGLKKLSKPDEEPDLLSILENPELCDADEGTAFNPIYLDEDVEVSTPPIIPKEEINEDERLVKNLDDQFSTTDKGFKLKTIIKQEKN